MHEIRLIVNTARYLKKKTKPTAISSESVGAKSSSAAVCEKEADTLDTSYNQKEQATHVEGEMTVNGDAETQKEECTKENKEDIPPDVNGNEINSVDQMERLEVTNGDSEGTNNLVIDEEAIAD